MNYKVGDKVRIRNDLEVYVRYGEWTFVYEMEKYKGKIATITEIDSVGDISIDLDDGYNYWPDEMLEPVEVTWLDKIDELETFDWETTVGAIKELEARLDKLSNECVERDMDLKSEQMDLSQRVNALEGKGILGNAKVMTDKEIREFKESKEPKLLQAPDFVIIDSYGTSIVDDDYNLIMQGNIYLNDWRLCSNRNKKGWTSLIPYFKKTTFKDLLIGSIFVDGRNINDIEDYMVKISNDGIEGAYMRVNKTYSIITPAKGRIMLQVVPKSEANVYEESD